MDKFEYSEDLPTMDVTDELCELCFQLNYNVYGKLAEKLKLEMFDQEKFNEKLRQKKVYTGVLDPPTGFIAYRQKGKYVKADMMGYKDVKDFYSNFLPQFITDIKNNVIVEGPNKSYFDVLAIRTGFEWVNDTERLKELLEMFNISYDKILENGTYITSTKPFPQKMWLHKAT